MEDFGDVDKPFRYRGRAESLPGVGLREKEELLLVCIIVYGNRGAEK